MTFPVDHDLHCHSGLSACSRDPEQTPQSIFQHAKDHGYTMVCITDHLWDDAVPGASRWYAPQTIEHVKQGLPYPKDDQVRMVFGCETEYCGGGKLGLHPDHFDEFDFIVIPPNHFHMKDFTRPSSYDTEEKIADLMVERLEELAQMDLPWHKVGIAHLNAGLIFLEGSAEKVFALVDETRFRAVMRIFSQKGAGIEINTSCFPENWREYEDAHLRMFRMAKEEGCKFYLASDAHHPEGLNSVHDLGPLVCELLGLEKEDQFVPARELS